MYPSTGTLSQPSAFGNSALTALTNKLIGHPDLSSKYLIGNA